MKLIGELFGNPLAKAKEAKETQSSHNTPQSIESPVISHGYRYIGVQLIGVVVAVAVVWQHFKPLADLSVPFLIVFVSFFGLIALRLLTFGETLSQTIPPRVIRQWRFLGLIPVWRREYPRKEFTGVQRRHCQSETGGKKSYNWEVGLVGPSDRFLPVQLFFSRGYDIPCPEVDTYASRLAEMTGLPLLDPIEV
jgi:hypothetical protein